MATMCPIDACKKKKVLCIHDKLMIGMVMLGGGLAIAHWGLHWF